MISTVCAAMMAVLAAPQPQVYQLNTQLPVWDVSARDVSGNGHDDIFAVAADDEPGSNERGLAVFLARDNGGYYGEPHFVLPLEDKVGSLFWAEVDGSEPKELVVAHAEGATIYQFTEGRFEVLAEPEFMSLFPESARRPRFLNDLAVDLTGDGIDEWLIPMPTGYAVRNAEEEIAYVRCEVDTGAGGGGEDGLTIRHSYPAFKAFDAPYSDNKAFVFLDDEQADFAYGPDWATRHRFELPLADDDEWDASAKLTDITGDGLPDLVITKLKGSLNVTVVTEVYLAEEPFVYPVEPTARYVFEGAFATPVVIDVDGDGRQDLVFLKVPYSIGSFVSYFLRGRVTVQADVYMYGDNGFSDRPAYTGSFPIEVPDGRRSVAYTMGDFSGNGHTDVAFGAGDDALVIHKNTPGEFLSRRPWLTLDVPPHGNARARDLSNNGIDDIIIYHPDSDLSKRIHVVLFE